MGLSPPCERRPLPVESSRQDLPAQAPGGRDPRPARTGAAAGSQLLQALEIAGGGDLLPRARPALELSLAALGGRAARVGLRL